MVTDEGRFAGRVGDVHIMVEDAHGKGELGQFLVRHEDIGLETSVLCRTHSGKVHTILGSPISALQITKVTGQEGHIRAPVLQSDEYTHADGMHTRLSHPVGGIHPPIEFRFHASWMIDVVTLGIISLLKTNHSVQSVVRKLLVFFGFQGHHLNLQIRKILLGDVECLGQIRYPRLGWILARYK